ncbi:TraV family lipoprotein [Thermodesulfovibrio thiophilus]|uniref:TraV family lipoprotein n=1 Tax=Thermodesulfovibrio thiophilus TaxID=340095 RepID=UPI0003FE6023|nr:TraV family lipoprotein [Thermodesulfovibrio thiophilus]
METWKITRFIKKGVFMLGVFALGCASAMNPYEDDFTCPMNEKGKCVPIKQAYEESKVLKLEEKATQPKEAVYSPLEEEYKDALFSKLANLLREPKTPVIAQPKIVRVMMLPYQGDSGKELYSARYIYLMVDEPKWILQNLTNLPPEGE